MNTIVQHIADFLKEYAPFDQLTFQELSDIATSIRVVNLEKTKRYSNLTMYCMIALCCSIRVIHLSVIADAEENQINVMKVPFWFASFSQKTIIE
jgi:CBS domain-containing protein